MSIMMSSCERGLNISVIYGMSFGRGVSERASQIGRLQRAVCIMALGFSFFLFQRYQPSFLDELAGIMHMFISIRTTIFWLG